MEVTCESKTIFKDRHNGIGISSAEFMQCSYNSFKNGKEAPKHPNDYLP